jgi:hypothetical protein
MVISGALTTCGFKEHPCFIWFLAGAVRARSLSNLEEEEEEIYICS